MQAVDNGYYFYLFLLIGFGPQGLFYNIGYRMSIAQAWALFFCYLFDLRDNQRRYFLS